MGPDTLILASTDAVREAFSANGDEIKPFTPQLTIPMSTRISQLAFTSDGELLVISAEIGGGLAFYETQGLVNGRTTSAFELPTGGKSVRALIPNPAPETAGMIAVVTSDGQLMIVDSKNKSFISGGAGQILKDGVSCVSWSNKGKQLVTGLGNGTASQMTPEGVAKAEIPLPSDLQGDNHGTYCALLEPHQWELITLVSSISWLENDVFLVVHTPNVKDDSGMAPPSVYHIVKRPSKTPNPNYTFQKLPEICAPFGLHRSPSFQYMQRLRDFPPDLKDLVIVATTSSEEIGLFTRSSKPLTNEIPADQIVDVFAATTFNEGRRAQVPMTPDFSSNTSVIGMALDLSSKSQVLRPIPGEEIEQSPGPLPALLLLNHEGVLCGWWVVYNDSVKQGTVYPGLVAAGGGQQLQQPATSASSAFGSSTAPTPSQPAFGQNPAPVNSTPSAFGFAAKPATSTFGNASFGLPHALGTKPSPWTSSVSTTTASATPAFGQPAFGTPAFGSTSAIGAGAQAPTFGNSGGLGPKPSPWASGNQSPAPGATFGQASTIGVQRQSPFAANSTAQSSTPSTFGASGGFASFAGAGGFASAASKPPLGETALKTTPAQSVFGSKEEGSSIFGSQPKTESSGTMFGAPKAGFSLGSSWTNPDAGKASASKPPEDKDSSLFGGGFAAALGETPTGSTPISKEADMMSDDDEAIPPKSTAAVSGAPETIPQQTSSSLFGTSKPLATSGGLFGLTVQKPESSSPKPPSIPFPVQDRTGKSSGTVPPIVKSEPEDESSGIPKKIQEAPLPPDAVSKATYTPGNSSASSVGASKASTDDAPLPPDPFTNSAPSKATPTEPPLPPDPLKKSTAPSSALFSDLPLPPDPTQKPTSNVKTPPKSSKGSESPVDRSPESSRFDQDEALPESDDDEPEDEGSGVDVAYEITSAAEPTPEPSPESSFLKTGGSSVGGSFEKVGLPQEGSSKSLFGEIGKSPIPPLKPPQRVQESPRSPSPVRLDPRSAMRAEPSRSFSAPGVPLRPDGARKVTLGRPAQPAAVYPPSFEQSIQQEERERVVRQKAQRQAEEEQELSDGEDASIRELLSMDVPPSLTLEPFVAYNDYVASVSKQGIPGQIEKVYRDVNSMIDTLGLNSRAVTAFIKGHEELGLYEGRTRADLEEESAWTLAEVEDLGAVVDALEGDLIEGKLQDPKALAVECRDFSRDLSRMKAKSADLKHSINAKNDPQLLESLRTAPLSVEQSTIRHDLRAKYTEFQRSLTQSEEAISMLKDKVASLQASSSKANGASKVPTVEAVEKTILKMTSMFEKRSGDIDLLETQMRKLNAFSTSPGSGDDSPYVTPPAYKRSATATGLTTPGSSTNGRSFYTPGSRGSALGASINAPSRRLRTPGKSTPGKQIASAPDAEAQAYAAKAAWKRQVRVLLKKALTAREPVVRTLDDL